MPDRMVRLNLKDKNEDGIKGIRFIRSFNGFDNLTDRVTLQPFPKFLFLKALAGMEWFDANDDDQP